MRAAALQLFPGFWPDRRRTTVQRLSGYVAASMYYRSSAQGHFPAQIVDVKTAMRFLRANAGEYDIEPDWDYGEGDVQGSKIYAL